MGISRRKLDEIEEVVKLDPLENSEVEAAAPETEEASTNLDLSE